MDRSLPHKILVRSFGFIFRRIFYKQYLFREWEEMGFHVLRKHFYSPVPNLSEVNRAELITSALPVGIDFRSDFQRSLLASFIKKYGEEFEKFNPGGKAYYGYKSGNTFFESVDCEMLYAMVRKQSPKRIIEVGSGNSTLVILEAIRDVKKNNKAYQCAYTSINPNHPDFLMPFEQDVKLVNKRLQDLDMTLFDQLGEGDILFIDSSHMVKVQSDAYYLYLRILPLIAKGVFVHIHDIFFPMDYPSDWFFKNHRFWNEQYVLQAFLTGNREFEVWWSSSFMDHYHAAELKDSLTGYNNRSNPGSFWMRRCDMHNEGVSNQTATESAPR